MRIGIDLGGTKTEAIALDDDGTELLRLRQPTEPTYSGTLAGIVALVSEVETRTGRNGSVGVGMPGAISAETGLVKNANSTWLLDRPFDRDIAEALGRDVRIANDANCLALSESVDGAGADDHVVFAVIIGTGTGAGLVAGGSLVEGRNRIAGEWGHNPLPWPTPDEQPGPPCYCGQRGCLETWVSGPALERDHRDRTREDMPAAAIAAAAASGETEAGESLRRYIHRLSRGLASVINVLDPDVVVVGGGVSNIERLYHDVPARLGAWVFGREVSTPIRRAVHGDASGVRGAAWLWDQSPRHRSTISMR